jgi:DNA replication protein DnaC
MLYHQTVDKLRSMRLEGMAQALEEQRRQKDITQLEFEERLGLLVERQWLWKESRGLTARIKNAQFKMSATLEDINYRHPRGLKRAQIEQLRASQWVQQHQQCILTGPTGIGKSYLACALGHQACRDGFRTLYFYAPKFFRLLHSAHADGSLHQLLKTLVKTRLLIIDDLGLAVASNSQYRDLLEVIDDRTGKGATLVTSQFPVAQWHEVIGDPTVADALLDRLVHSAYRLELDGKSMRDPKNAPSDKKGED